MNKPEVRFGSPDERNPERISLSELFKNPTREDIIEVYIEWHDGTYGTKIPIVVIKAV